VQKKQLDDKKSRNAVKRRIATVEYNTGAHLVQSRVIVVGVKFRVFTGSTKFRFSHAHDVLEQSFIAHLVGQEVAAQLVPYLASRQAAQPTYSFKRS